MIKEWVLRKASQSQERQVADWCSAAAQAACHAGYRPTETDVVVLRTVADMANRQAIKLVDQRNADEERYRDGSRTAAYNKDVAEWRWLAAECQREAHRLHDLDLIANAARCAG